MTDDIAFRLSEIHRARARLEQLGGQHVDSLLLFYDDTHHGFQRLQANVGKRSEISESSTATCVLSLNEADRWRQVGGRKTPAWRGHEVEIADRLLGAPWTSAGLDPNNPYSVAWMLEGVASVYAQAGNGPSNEHVEKLRKAREIVIAPLREGSIQLAAFPPSAYLTQLGLRALMRSARLVGEEPVPADIRENVRNKARAGLERQIALLATESRLGDVYELAYATILFATTRERGVGWPDDLFMIRAGIARLFELQKSDGTWPRGHPLFVHKDGNAHCYEFEMLSQFVELRHQSDVLPHLLEQVPALIKAVDALDAERFELAAGTASGWSSRFYPPNPVPESWSTASAFHFAYALDRLLSEASRRLIFEDIGATYPLSLTAPATGVEYLRERLADSALPDPGDNKPATRPHYSLIDVVWKLFIDPIRRQQDAVERGHAFDDTVPIAAILFGPPGTAKTTLAKTIAGSLGWPLLELDPSNFLRLGLDRVEAEADRIFGMLARADQLVVFLDEFDEMVRARQTAKELESRFLTTSMLPKLANIRRKRRIVFIVATNHVGNFDVAIGRRGRFDLILQVLPPMASAKFEKHELPLDLLKDEKLRQRVSQLTWDEFREIVDAVKQGGDGARSAINDQFAQCMMNARVGPQNEGKWADLCERERTQSRFPSTRASVLFTGPLEPDPTLAQS